MRPRIAGAAPLLLLFACGGAPPVEVATPAPVPSPSPGPAARSGLGDHHRAITTSVAGAQEAFDRGLVLAFAFNHGAAEREFRTCAELDAASAMAWWGIALVNGPHINNPMMTPEASQAAWQAWSKAKALAAGASEVEKALVEALGNRYAENPPEDRRPLDEGYARAMSEVWKAHPADADVGALQAEALMDLRPWDLWTQDGKPQPGTEEILATLERVMELDRQHPLANHLYIHATEGSPHPEKGMAAADRLRDLVPAAGHLVHMPAHTDIRTGRWAEASQANRAAIEADAVFRKTAAEPGFYRIYMAHNHQFLSFASMMQGQSGEALKAAREMVAGMPAEFIQASAFFVDGVLVLPTEVLIRFGRWEEVLAEPEPAEYLPVSRAFRHYARATALTALGRREEAEKERAAFAEARGKLSPDAIMLNNKASEVLAIAASVLDGEMAAKKGDFKAALASLAGAAKREDALRYDEPPDWLQPVRHTLGQVLLGAGKPAEAEAVYRQDLARFPENGWSLYGLGRALRLQKKDAEAAETEKRFERAWSRADIQIAATCLCQPPV